MDDSDSSALSEHSDKEIQKLAPVFQRAKAANKIKFPPPKSSPPRPKRAPSPPHEEVLADNPDIAFIVMFRSRFNDAMPSKLPNYGPQDIERGVSDVSPSPEVSQLLCALLALVLNRKKPVERGHYGRALEEAVLSNKKDWPHKWNEVNPLHGGKNFENMSTTERLNLLRTLVIWALDKSEAIQAIIKDKYKQQRHSDDENQPLSIQPWGSDGDKRRYFLVQGLEDTTFRIYREGDRHKKTAHWYSMAGSIEEAQQLAKKLEEVDGSQAARRLANKIINAVPMFEATEEKRRRREYRQVRRAAFSRPEPGFSIYEGRTRGKRMRYTYDDDEDAFESDATSTRRSARQSGRSTPFEAGPTVTASGWQIRQPRTGEYGESLLRAPPLSTDELAPGYSDFDGAIPRGRSGSDDSEEPVRGASGRATRAAGRPAANGHIGKRKHIDTYNNIDEMSDEDEVDGDDWDSDKNEGEDEDMPDVRQDDDMSEADEESEDEDGEEEGGEEPQSLVLKLKVPLKALSTLKMQSSSPRSASPDDTITYAQGGALKQEVAEQKLANGVDSRQSVDGAAEHMMVSSPIGPSAYPTPTSTSYLPPDQKPLGLAVPQAQSTAQPTFASQPDALYLPDRATPQQLSNGMIQNETGAHVVGGRSEGTFRQY